MISIDTAKEEIQILGKVSWNQCYGTVCSPSSIRTCLLVKKQEKKDVSSRTEIGVIPSGLQVHRSTERLKRTISFCSYKCGNCWNIFAGWWTELWQPSRMKSPLAFSMNKALTCSWLGWTSLLPEKNSWPWLHIPPPPHSLILLRPRVAPLGTAQNLVCFEQRPGQRGIPQEASFQKSQLVLSSCYGSFLL